MYFSCDCVNKSASEADRFEIQNPNATDVDFRMLRHVPTSYPQRFLSRTNGGRTMRSANSDLPENGH